MYYVTRVRRQADDTFGSTDTAAQLTSSIRGSVREADTPINRSANRSVASRRARDKFPACRHATPHLPTSRRRGNVDR